MLRSNTPNKCQAEFFFTEVNNFICTILALTVTFRSSASNGSILFCKGSVASSSASAISDLTASLNRSLSSLDMKNCVSSDLMASFISAQSSSNCCDCLVFEILLSLQLFCFL